MGLRGWKRTKKWQKEMRVRSCVIIGNAPFQKLRAKIWHVPKIRHVPKNKEIKLGTCQKINFVGGDDSSTGKSEFQKQECSSILGIWLIHKFRKSRVFSIWSENAMYKGNKWGNLARDQFSSRFSRKIYAGQTISNRLCMDIVSKDRFHKLHY